MNGNNNNVLFEDNSYHNNYYENRKRNELRQNQLQDMRSIEQGGQGLQRMLPVVVTMCLAPHEECTGEYIDTTHSFRLRCFCECHLNRKTSDNLVGRITK
ncbi:hypothetical protein BH18THE2_BH18THE2_26250 [soil metagenome]